MSQDDNYAWDLSIQQKEQRWNENFINQKKAQYNKKYQLDKQNIYNRVFSYLNEKIQFEIELNKTKQKFQQGKKDKFKVNNYEDLYEFSSSRAIGIFRSQNQKLKRSKKSYELPLIRQVKNINITKSNKLQKSHSLKILKNQIFDYDQRLKFQIQIKQKKEALGNMFTKLNKKLKSKGLNQKKISTAELLKIDELENMKPINKISKTSYLVSLNYDFKNPII